MPNVNTSPASSPVDPISSVAALIAGKKVPPDAVNLLIQDHREVEALFNAYERIDDSGAKMRLAARICLDLKAHMQVEEEIFYPAVRQATADESLVNHAVEEHAGAKRLIAQIEHYEATGVAFDLLVQELRQAIEKHVAEEEGELFPQTRESDLELYGLGRQLAAHRIEIFGGLMHKPVPVITEEALM